MGWPHFELSNRLCRSLSSRLRRRSRIALAAERLEDRLAPAAGEIHGVVWNDINGTGIRDSGEPGLADRVVYLDQNRNGLADAGELSATTAADGSYAFTDLALGTYYVAELLPDGWQQSSPTTADRTVTLSGSQQTLFTFQELASTTTYTINPYRNSGFTFDTTMSSGYTKFRVFGTSDSFYAGSTSLTSQWAPVNISLTKDDGTPFTLRSMSLSEYGPGFGSTVNFTGTRADGSTVQQTVTLDGTFGFQPITFNNFTDMKSVTWGFGSNPSGSASYHQFDNVQVTFGGASIVTGVDFGTINRPQPEVTINDVTIAEGNSGTRNAIFTVRLGDYYNPYTVTVYYRTSDGTAIYGSDYGTPAAGPISGSVTIRPGSNTATVSIPIFGDATVEPHETFFVNLTAAQNGRITDSQGVGTIFNDEGLNAANDAYATDEDTPLAVPAPGVLGNDTAANAGDTLSSYRFGNGPAHGTLTLNADGSFAYTPAANYNGLDSFSYFVTEGPAISNIATVNITVRPVNDPPVANNDSYTVDEDHVLTGPAGVGVTSLYLNSQPGDYIGQGQTVTYTPSDGKFSASRNFDNGVSISFSGPSHWWYTDFAAPYNATLTPGYYGNAARFPFQQDSQPGLSVTGDGRGSNTLTGNFTVNEAVYDETGKVLAFDATFEQHSEGATPALFGQVKFNAGARPGSVLDNDTDIDGGALTAILVSGPAHGALTLNADGTFSYVPDANFNGVDQFTYMANDGQLNSSPATVTITVNAVNDAPSFMKGADQITPEGSGAQTVAGWASNIAAGPPDEAGQSLSFLVATNNNALFSVLPAIDPSTGTLTYTPTGAVGSATVTVRLRDSGGTAGGGADTSAAQTFLITVQNLAPAVTGPADQSASEGAGQAFVLGSFADWAGDGPWAVDVNWGDGSAHTNFTTIGAGSLGSLSHTFANDGTYTVSVAVTDKFTAVGVETFAVTVAAVPPTLTLSGAATVPEGSVYTLNLAATQYDADVILGWTIDWGDGTTESLPGNPSTATHIYADGPKSHTIGGTATDEDGAYSANSLSIFVANAAPAAMLQGPAGGVRGQPLAYTLFANDPSAVDQAAGFAYTVDWGDGTAQALSGTSGVPMAHIFAAAGAYTVRLTATDKDGGVSAEFALAVNIQAVQLQSENLVVGGTGAGDSITARPADTAGNFSLTLNGALQGTFDPSVRIIVYGQAGADVIQLLSTKFKSQTKYVTASAVLFGDDGNDTLDARGSTANNILVGGAGDDSLQGGAGRDVLIGGQGADAIRGEGGDDIVIGNSTEFDTNLTILDLLLAEWSQTDIDYLTRMRHLDGSLAGGLNGAYLLNALTVFDDQAVDQLFGGGGLDWFLATGAGSFKDKVRDRQTGEVVTLL